jgi:hypothetical protein
MHEARLARQLVGAAAVGCLVLVAPVVRAELVPPPAKPDKARTHGPGISVGIGSPYVGIGVQVAYYLELPRSRFRVAPYAAAGSVLWSFGPVYPDDGWHTGATAGLLASWGHRHRITVDLYYGAVGTTSLSLHGEAPDTELEWGPGAAVGYEYLARSGFFLRTSFGLHYVVTAPILALEDRIAFGGTFVGLGYKLW